MSVDSHDTLLPQQGHFQRPSTARRIARWVYSAYKLELRSPPWQGRRCASRCIPRLKHYQNLNRVRLKLSPQTYVEV